MYCHFMFFTVILTIVFLQHDARLAWCHHVSVHQSIRHMVISQYCIETTGRIKLLLVWMLPSTYLTLCYKETWVSPKITVLPSWTLSQTMYLENFTTASQSCCQQNLSTSSAVEFVDDTDNTINKLWMFTTSQSTVGIVELCDYARA